MSEHPILFNTDMVKAILDGRKTQTRRIIKPQPFLGDKFQNYEPQVGKCPYGYEGDRLWVRETFAEPFGKGMGVIYRADYGENLHTWKPSIFMPRWASRITLEVTAVRVERLQEISGKDAQQEGFPWHGIGATLQFGYRPPLTWFSDLWDSLNAKRGYGWSNNPWVWCISFRKIE